MPLALDDQGDGRIVYANVCERRASLCLTNTFFPLTEREKKCIYVKREKLGEIKENITL